MAKRTKKPDAMAQDASAAARAVLSADHLNELARQQRAAAPDGMLPSERAMQQTREIMPRALEKVKKSRAAMGLPSIPERTYRGRQTQSAPARSGEDQPELISILRAALMEKPEGHALAEGPWQERDDIDHAIKKTQELIDAARAVVACWESGNLAEAVNTLRRLVE